MSVELNGAKWTTWDDVRKEMFMEEETAESDLHVALIGKLMKSRKENSQRAIKKQKDGKR